MSSNQQTAGLWPSLHLPPFPLAPSDKSLWLHFCLLSHPCPHPSASPPPSSAVVSSPPLHPPSMLGRLPQDSSADWVRGLQCRWLSRFPLKWPKFPDSRSCPPPFLLLTRTHPSYWSATSFSPLYQHLQRTFGLVSGPFFFSVYNLLCFTWSQSSWAGMSAKIRGYFLSPFRRGDNSTWQKIVFSRICRWVLKPRIDRHQRIDGPAFPIALIRPMSCACSVKNMPLLLPWLERRQSESTFAYIIPVMPYRKDVAKQNQTFHKS